MVPWRPIARREAGVHLPPPPADPGHVHRFVHSHVAARSKIGRAIVHGTGLLMASDSMRDSSRDVVHAPADEALSSSDVAFAAVLPLPSASRRLVAWAVQFATSSWLRITCERPNRQALRRHGVVGTAHAASSIRALDRSASAGAPQSDAAAVSRLEGVSAWRGAGSVVRLVMAAAAADSSERMAVTSPRGHAALPVQTYTTSAPEASVEMATKFRLSFGFGNIEPFRWPRLLRRATQPLLSP